MMTRVLAGASCGAVMLVALCAIAEQPDDALRRLPAIGYGPSPRVYVADLPEGISDVRSTREAGSSTTNRRDSGFVVPVANTNPTVVVPGVMGSRPVRVEPFESADAPESGDAPPSSPIVVPLVDDPMGSDLPEEANSPPLVQPEPQTASRNAAVEGLPDPVVVEPPAVSEGTESEWIIDPDPAPRPPVTGPAVTETTPLPPRLDTRAQPPTPITAEPLAGGTEAYDAAPLQPPAVFAPAEPPAQRENDPSETSADVWSNASSQGSDDSKGAFGAVGKWKTYWRTTLKPRLQSTHWGYAPLFYEAPFGSQLEAHLSTQVQNGVSDRMVLYQYDFFDGFGGPPEQLNPRGMEELDRIVGFLAVVEHPIVVERSGDANLDQMRRLAVVDRLRQTGRGLAENCVVVGRPAATGLLRGAPMGRPSEAESNYQNLLNHANQRGESSLGASGGQTEDF